MSSKRDVMVRDLLVYECRPCGALFAVELCQDNTVCPTCRATLDHGVVLVDTKGTLWFNQGRAAAQA